MINSIGKYGYTRLSSRRDVIYIDSNPPGRMVKKKKKTETAQVLHRNRGAVVVVLVTPTC